MKECKIHGKDCPGDDGGFLIDGNHPDDMYSVGPEPTKFQKVYLLFCFDSGQYETYLCDIYTTREKAETERENRQKKPTKYSSRTYEVQEWEIQE